MSPATQEPLLVDASVALKWFLPPEREPRADLARELIGNSSLLTTTLVIHEIANILVRSSGLSKPEIKRAMNLLDDICGEPAGLTREDREMSIELATRHRITFYDASYAAIAIRLRRTLVSDDSDLIDPGLAKSLIDLGG